MPSPLGVGRSPDAGRVPGEAPRCPMRPQGKFTKGVKLARQREAPPLRIGISSDGILQEGRSNRQRGRGV